MRIQTRRQSVWTGGCCSALLVALLALGVAPSAHAQSEALTELLSGVVRMKTFINPDGRTTQNLGREREGSAVVIDSNGLILTIGYLMVEAHSAEIVTNDGQDVPANIVGYDHQTGSALPSQIAGNTAFPNLVPGISFTGYDAPFAFDDASVSKSPALSYV